MPTMKSSFGAAGFVVAAAILCACDSRNGDGGPVGAVSLDEFAPRAAEATCAQNLKCSSAADLAGRTQQQCTDDARIGLSLLATSIDEGRSRGRISYDAGKMGMCIVAVGQLTCDSWLLGFTLSKNQPAVCLAAVAPLVPVGSPCQQDIECTTGHCEAPDPISAPPVDGTCTQAVAAGNSCAGGLTCVDGLYCEDTSQKCTERKAAGKACVSDDECLNACNAASHLCSSYVGCGVAGGDSPPTLGAWLLAGAALLIRTLRRRARG